VRGSFDGALEAVAPIVADVRERGDSALLEWTERLDAPRPDGIRVPAERIEVARVEDDVLDALRRMIAAVRRFSEAQRPADTRVKRLRASSPSAAGSARLGRRLRPEWPCAASVLARDDRRAGAGGQGRPDRES
jgi:hypothetical protein